MTYFLSTEDVSDMKKLWVIWFLLFISMATAEKLNDTIGRLTDNELNCTTRECVKDNLEFELTMLNNMNPSVDPCDNFYEFACGNFDNVPDDIVQDTHHSTFYRVFIDMLQKMYNIIEKSRSSESFQPFNFLNDFLISCRRVNNNNNPSDPGIKRDDLDYLKEIISKLGGWPVVEGHKWNETNNSWINFIDEAKHIAFFYYYFYGLRSRSINNRTTIFFQPIDLEFSGGNMTNPQNHKMAVPYLNFMVDVANLLGANKTHSKEELAPLVTFELQIADIKMQNDRSLSSNKNNQIELSVTKVIEKWPSIDWIKLVNTRSALSRNISNETVISIENTDVITKLDNLVKNTTARVRANYAMWKTIQYLIPMIESASLSRLSLIYNKIKDPSYVHATYDCLKELKELFPELMLAYYGRNSPIGKRAKIQIHQLISFVEQQFFDTLNSTKWLDMKTRDGLFQALKSLKLRIGYPDEIMDDRKLTEYFQGLNITHDNFLRNFVNRKVFTAKKVFNFNHMPQNSIGFMDNFYTFTLFEGDAFFNPHTNTIVLGVELLRNLFFSIHRPNYVNIALLGDKLAHEIGHSIDHPYDIYESKANNSKWSESSKQKYHDIRECIAQQFSNYSSKVTGKKVDGGFYLQENIADIIGVQVAYSTYQDWVKTHGQGRTFFSLPYNTNQLFWLSFANQWCWPKSTLRNWNSNDEHPSPAHRVIVPLFNSPEFSKDFNCPSGSNMNPVKKCIVF